MTLNAEQLDIVQTEPKLKTLLRILAGAGSGKSTTAANRVKYLMDFYKIQPKHILLMTFSNRAARDLRNKIKTVTGLKGKKLPTVSTIHGLCLDIIKRFSDEEKIVLSSWEDLMIFRDSLEAYLGDYDTQKKILTPVALAITQLLSELYSTYEFNRFEDSLETIMYDNSSMFEDFNDPNIITLTYRDFYEIVSISDRYKVGNNLLSFDDIVYKAFELITSDDEVLAWVRKTYIYTFIDESQDNNALNHLLVYNVFNTGHTTLIGDLSQEIYQFRWSDSRYLAEESLSTVYNEVTTKYLTYNFRSAHPIVTLGNMLRGYSKSEVIQKPADFTKSLPKRVFIQKVKNQVAEGKNSAKHIKQLLSEGVEPKDIAVITRTNKYITTILEPALIELNIPYIIQGSKTRKLTDKSEVLYLIHCFQLMVAPPKAQVFIMKQVLENLQGIGNATAKKLYEYLNGNIWGLINLNDKKYNCVSGLVKYVQECSLNGLDVIKVGHYIDSFLEFSKFDLKPLYVAELKQLFSNWAEIYIEDTGKTLEQIIPEIQTSLDSVEEETANVVKLSTVHSTKGLEYEHVICTGFTYKSKKLAKPTLEELNIFYVQVSRAIKSLLIVHSDIITYMGQEIKGYKMKWLVKLLQDLEN
jgi:DNA helicase-2/ATP-dependent DNA helicase PcrA